MAVLRSHAQFDAQDETQPHWPHWKGLQYACLLANPVLMSDDIQLRVVLTLEPVIVRRLHMTSPPASSRGLLTLSASRPIGINATAYSTCMCPHVFSNLKML